MQLVGLSRTDSRFSSVVRVQVDVSVIYLDYAIEIVK